MVFHFKAHVFLFTAFSLSNVKFFLRLEAKNLLTKHHAYDIINIRFSTSIHKSRTPHNLHPNTTRATQRKEPQ